MKLSSLERAVYAAARHLSAAGPLEAVSPRTHQQRLTDWRVIPE